ncbi:hypothetical protein ACFYYY_20710 [Streptomyces sp. NPDC001834]|uniref:hypothetical protein n=1 Tax=Streptomyces sp. NPDC001834 TaxID=3364616 RepID=UPI00369CB41D
MKPHCFGPADTANLPALVPLIRRDGMDDADIARYLHTFNVTARVGVSGRGRWTPPRAVPVGPPTGTAEAAWRPLGLGVHTAWERPRMSHVRATEAGPDSGLSLGAGSWTL